MVNLYSVLKIIAFLQFRTDYQTRSCFFWLKLSEIKSPNKQNQIFPSIETINFDYSRANILIVYAELAEVFGLIISNSDLADCPTTYSACFDLHPQL